MHTYFQEYKSCENLELTMYFFYRDWSYSCVQNVYTVQVGQQYLQIWDLEI